ncbi:hypothetical protein C0W92_12685 [Photobacterium angustum]|uniref:Uncharacterized protein n=1 Tax=Photobacterium angustum TaxID=661 RepID=A0A855SDP4_PHOAN|nr:hypothetical protein [Photobacterium angustum]PSV90155.1 hypothetical protein CTN01_16440 [Photobacterium angustum]PSW83327.1 hypothetical protein CTN03_02505 [Photobacterium angustum]PSW89805.1 hypothetical protein C0W92_12685 [Photobacterium angustum]PSX06802.1 hypothetical protein C0W41_12275 [Photobacterium angustum]PSX14701.1 hypothetical protein C0W55_08125 [Photobacterium angustum]
MKKLEIAVVQLDRAIELFLNEKDYICCITLAGAAEEIFGKYLTHNGKKSFSDDAPYKIRECFDVEDNDSKIRNDHLNFVKNELKHFNVPDREQINVYWEGQAFMMLSRAVINYVNITDEESSLINRFHQWTLNNSERIKETAQQSDIS